LAGVTVVENGDLVAVLHADPEAANRALQLIAAGDRRRRSTQNRSAVGLERRR
jgi:hypothetical protein